MFFFEVSFRALAFFAFLVLQAFCVYPQVPVKITDTVNQHIFTFNELEFFEDKAGLLTMDDIADKQFSKSFKPSIYSTPHFQSSDSYYWFRIKTRINQPLTNGFIIEFFDQTLNEITAYIPTKNGYTTKVYGDSLAFQNRLFQHKNFQININNSVGEAVYYFRIRSAPTADIIIVLRSVPWFIHYALDEYFSFGIFYGMLIVFSFYNLILFLAIRRWQYLYYLLYIISLGMYVMCTDGIAYQYLWPQSPKWNEYAYAFALYSVSVFAVLFTKSLLHTKVRAKTCNKIINGYLVVRSALFICGLLLFPQILTYRSVEFATLCLILTIALVVYKNGYKPARFLVLGYGFLFIGFILKLLITLTHGAFNFGILSYYSINFCFILEMGLLSFAIGDRVRLLKKNKDYTQRVNLEQAIANERLKDVLNKELEQLVDKRTHEVFEKSEIIEHQNEELLAVNDLLKQQSEEILRMNLLLEQDKLNLQHDIENVTRARIMSTTVNFEEFSKIYPDEKSCYQFLESLKWQPEYACKRCDHTDYIAGNLHLSRRCRKCNYDESVTANTIFQNSRIPINKAFYMLFLIYNSQGKISSYKLSEILSIRQSTCWAYSIKVKKNMDDRKKLLKDANKDWSKLILS